jgi:hypothetical protein
MQHRCEVCASFRPNAEFDERYRVVPVAFAERTVHLCVAHARIAENSGVTSFEGLREIYGEGRRSFVPRRGPSTTPTNDRRRTAGRRASDA